MSNTHAKQFVPTIAQEFKDDNILEVLNYAIEDNKPALLIGETGTGKTSAIRYLAKKHGLGFRRLNLNGATTVDDIVGKILLNERGTLWVDGVLTDAVRNGYIVLLDEINAALPEILFAIHSLMDDDGMLVLAENMGEVLKPHPNFRLFAAMNHGYEGTRSLNKAFLSRFQIVVPFNYIGWEDVDGKKIKPEMEVALLVGRTGIKQDVAERMVVMVNSLRQSYRQDRLSFPVSFRELQGWAELMSKFSEETAFRLAIVNKFLPEERTSVVDAYEIMVKA